MKKLIVVYFLIFNFVANAQLAFDAPENVYWHAPSKTWFVSNLGGGKVTLEKDGVGWVTRLDEQGNVLAAQWVAGLDAPTGMAAVGDILYVADRGVVVLIDIPAAKIIKKIELKGSEFVNDIAAAPNGDIYISDTFTDRIYRLQKGSQEAEVFIESSKLEYPNGLLIDNENIIVATWGPMVNRSTFETSRPGTILKVNLKTKTISPLGDGRPVANLDGIVKVGKYYFATDWVNGRLLKISQSGIVTEVIKGFKQFADLGCDPERGILGMPEMSSNRVFFMNINTIR